MTSDDDWRSRVDDHWRWRHAQDDRQWAEKRAQEDSRRLHEALGKGDYDAARWPLGIPPAGTASHDDEELERTEPPTAGDQFREHRNALLFNLRWAERFLPQEMLDDWTARVDRLDIEAAEAGLAEIEAIGGEYQRAVDRFEPSHREVSRRMDWDYYVPRIGHEIEWVAALYRHVLSFG